MSLSKLLAKTFSNFVAAATDSETCREIAPLYEYFKGRDEDFEIDHLGWELLINPAKESLGDPTLHPISMAVNALMKAGANHPPASLAKEAFMKPDNAYIFAAMLVGDSRFFILTDDECQWVDIAYSIAFEPVVRLLEEQGLASSSTSTDHLKALLNFSANHPNRSGDVTQVIDYMLRKGYLSADQLNTTESCYYNHPSAGFKA